MNDLEMFFKKQPSCLRLLFFFSLHFRGVFWSVTFFSTLKKHFLFQIDPALLQQTLQQGGLLSQPLSVDTGLVSHSGSQLMSTTDSSVSANVVIHPLTSLALQPSAITTAQVTMAGLSEQDTTGMCGSLRWEQDSAVSVTGWITKLDFLLDSAGSQDLSHVMGSSGLIAGGSSAQEITLTLSNPSLTQALASASCSSAAAGNPQEITLTISGVDYFV